MILIRNPLLKQGADPWLTQADGRWYFICTRTDRLELLCADDLGRLA